MKNRHLYWFLVVAAVVVLSGCTKGSGFEKLDEWTEIWKEGQQTYIYYSSTSELIPPEDL